jgi:hypothetical protein
MGTDAIDFLHKWIDENVSAKFHGPGDVEMLVAKCKADAQDADFAPDDIEYESAEFYRDVDP